MEGKGGKIRFDLKQISAWDKQNESEMKKKATGKPIGKGFKNPHFSEDKDDEGFEHGYRDRALERRKEINTEDAQMEEIVSKLDVQQTKYLGGDIEHTHLVKGLDYALLEKSRKQKEKEDAQLQHTSSTTQQHDLTLSEIQPHTKIGSDVYNILSKIQTNTAKATGKLGMALTPGSILQRTVYEYNMSSEADIDVPLLVTKSRTECNNNDEYINYMLDTTILQDLSGLLKTGKFLTIKQKKKILKEKEINEKIQLETQEKKELELNNHINTSSNYNSSSLVDNDFDIYGDDEINGKYIPAGSLEEDNVNLSSSSTSAEVKQSTLGSAEVKNLFSHTTTNSTTATTSSSMNNKTADLMQPIRDLLSAQTNKERAKNERLHIQQQQQNEEILLETDKNGQLLVHRDVFATSKDKIVNATSSSMNSKEKQKQGEVFGTKGGYDLFPETTGSYEQYDSDDAAPVDETAPPAAKKSRLEGSNSSGKSEWEHSARPSGGSSGGDVSTGYGHKTGLEGFKKASMTPWRQQPKSRSTGNSDGGSNTSSTMNRAARRASGKP